MKPVDLRVIRTIDPPPFPELSEKVVCSSEIDKVAILQAGMQSGKSSIAFLITLPTGDVVFAEMSAAILDMIHGASVGARQSWGEMPS